MLVEKLADESTILPAPFALRAEDLEIGVLGDLPDLLADAVNRLVASRLLGDFRCLDLALVFQCLGKLPAGA